MPQIPAEISVYSPNENKLFRLRKLKYPVNRLEMNYLLSEQ